MIEKPCREWEWVANLRVHLERARAILAATRQRAATEAPVAVFGMPQRDERIRLA